MTQYDSENFKNEYSKFQKEGNIWLNCGVVLKVQIQGSQTKTKI